MRKRKLTTEKNDNKVFKKRHPKAELAKTEEDKTEKLKKVKTENK